MKIVRTRACSPNDKYTKQMEKNGERRNRKEKTHLVAHKVNINRPDPSQMRERLEQTKRERERNDVDVE